MKKFRKKPVEIEAIQFDGTDETSIAIRSWAEPAVAIVDTDHIQHHWDYDLGGYRLPSGKPIMAPYQQRCLIVLTLEGEMIASGGDCEQAFAENRGTWRDILVEEVFEAFAESEPALLREEPLQVAAVAVAWVQAIDRQAARA